MTTSISQYIDRLVKAGGIETKVLNLAEIVLYGEEDEIDEYYYFLMALHKDTIKDSYYFLAGQELTKLSEQWSQKLTADLLEDKKNNTLFEKLREGLDEIKNGLGQDDPEQFVLQEVMRGIATLLHGMINLKTYMDMNPFKIYLDHVTTYRTQDGELLYKNKELLDGELTKLLEMQKMILRSIDRTMVELPNSRKQINESLLIPLSVKKLVMDAMTAKMALSIVSRAIMVANYFITESIEYWEWKV